MKTIAQYLRRNAVMASLFFVGLSLLVLPNNSEVLTVLYGSETQLVDSTQNAVLSQNTENVDSSNSNADSDNLKDSRWFRLVKENGLPVELDTSIVRYAGVYKDKAGVEREVSVDLVGAIHLAEKSYYDSINAEFKQYETVVFELISAKGVDPKVSIRAERESQSSPSFSPLNIVSLSQMYMSRALGLVYQIDGVDYLADNLRRGDMDAEDFIIQLFTNGDALNFVSDAFFSSFFPGEDATFESWAIALLVSKDRRLTLRRLMAMELLRSALDEIDDASKKINAGGKENVLIQLRNKEAMKVAVSELNAGKTKIAIFYGAAHLPDLERRLENELHLTRDPNTRWFPAWNMR